jgi:murein DD-endopeptidase MepM/ murein hydrolase activator NlpD
MLLTRVWFLIAGLLLLSYTPSLAEPYLRVIKNGVVHYYYNNRDTARPGPDKKLAPKLQAESQVTMPSAPPQLLPASFLLPVSTASCADLNAEPFQPDINSAQFLPGTSLLTRGDNPGEPDETTGPAKRGFLKLLTKLGFFDPPDAPFGDDGPQWLLPDSNSELDFVVPDMWQKAPKYFQAPPETPNALASPKVAIPLPRYAYQPRLWGRVPPTLKGQPGLTYCFPVARPFTFRDTWGDPRPGGRQHRAVDVFAPEGTELYAITSGVVSRLGTSSTGGIMLFLAGHDGRGYGYMHLHSYAPGIVPGKAVRAGELIAYMGHTGTQNCADHLHIQVYPDHGFSTENLINPYDFMVQLCRGIGVTDFNQPKLARNALPNPRVKTKTPTELLAKLNKNNEKWIKVYQRPFGEQRIQLSIQGSPASPTLVIRKF